MPCKNRHKLSLLEDLQLLRKTFDFYGRFIISIPEDLSTAPEHLLIATEHFRNYPGALS